MQTAERAYTHFLGGYNCAQSVLAAFADRYRLPMETAFRIAAGFGAGSSRTGGTCGAVNGALMVIGLARGHTLPDDLAAKEETYRLVARFINAFEQRHGSIRCPELLGYDLDDPAQRAEARSKNLSVTVCSGLVRESVEILEQIL